ncbi:verrucotoxin subunit beta-like [Pempheris klunzingeri]|uniref:verrucotoxin subunit beta-like n=1 Tax=Pempheris klunzingeri TaxID=3127111 RepID=UPI00397FB807
MDPKNRNTTTVAALGRPFTLGKLYDCRHHALIPGMSLWDRDDLTHHVVEKTQKYNDVQIFASESISEKSSALSIGVSLKASIVFGLINLSGSAKYLNSKKTSRNQARVTMKYEATTKFQELSMDHLGRGNVKYPYVFEEGIATHVVTGILYGAQAFFVFDREVSEDESYEEYENNFSGILKKASNMVMNLKDSLKMNATDTKTVEKFSCTFLGDFSLKQTPTSFQDAIEVYQNLPKLLGANGENAIPLKVWLMPLTRFHSFAYKLVREISAVVVDKSQTVLEDFGELEIRCNDALRSTAEQFPQISRKIKTFKELLSKFKLTFQQNMGMTLPLIHGRQRQEIILKMSIISPFNSKSLNEWMDWKEREICIVKALTNLMKNTKVVPSHTALYKEVLSAEDAVCFVFTSLGSPEPFLSALSDYLKQTPKPDPHAQDAEKDQWFASKEVGDAMVHKAKLFGDFAEANKENKTTKFLTVGLTNETQKGSSICIYKDGFSVNDNFEPPSKPESVTASDVTNDSVTLKISPPKFGAENITSYSVKYAVSGEDEWKEQTTSNTEQEVTVSDLIPDTEYKFRVRAVTAVGFSPAAEVSVQTST